tara:strand:+ start:1452 stop:1622 length:171 start_codon:yes stop_codon:yes gene_type:complete
MNSSVIHVATMQRELQNIALMTKIVPEELVVPRKKTGQPFPESWSLTITQDLPPRH